MARNEPNPTRAELSRISQLGLEGELGRSSGPDPVEILTDEHDRLQLLLNEYEGSDSAGKQTLRKRICDELETHLRMEEEVFYPAISALSDEAWQAVDGVQAEHGSLKAVLSYIRNAEISDADFDENFGRLTELIELHADRDEHDVHPTTYELTQSDLELIGNRMLDLRERILGTRWA